ncbi:MAG: amino acid--tRNA ligase-related protein [Planctomycetota bacterium]
MAETREGLFVSEQPENPPHHWRPTAELANLRARAEWTRWLRNYFWQREYWEVETPLLLRETIVDRHLDPPRVPAAALGLGPEHAGDWFLQTSPEFGMKRLLAAGAERIFQIGKAFRAGEVGRLHNPEFTMLEWYDAAANYEQGIGFLQELAAAFFGTSGCERETYSHLWCRGLSTALRVPETVAEQLLRGGLPELRNAVGRLPGMDPESVLTWDRDSLLNLVWTECVESTLGQEQPIIVADWPASQAALARTRNASTGEVAERFELYYRGVELANGYHELVDAGIFQQRTRNNNQLRALDGKSVLPEDSRLGQALRTEPRLGAGVAAGVDRWIMLKLGATSLAEVLAFPANRA